jgi:hypothetical protein
MKTSKARREERFIEEIVGTLKSVPQTRLRIVRDVVEALAEPTVPDKNAKRAARKSLLRTPFCGMWERLPDIDNGSSYARTLRQKLERRGDRS